jgi:molybdopterin-synthase adenylyltransferase
MILTNYDRDRYQRQLLLDGWDEPGQARLKASSVFIAGAGGLGSAVSMYLAAAGVGTLRICDRDRVELSNLNRQILHNDSRIGLMKADSAAQSLQALNPAIEVIATTATIDGDSIEALAAHPDLVIDCLDNFETRHVLNEYCCRNDIPLIHGGVWGLSGQVTFIHPPQTPCLKCIFPRFSPPTVVPVVGATAGLIGCIQAAEALKYLTGIGPTLAGKMLTYDGTDMSTSQLNLARNPKCPVCNRLHDVA